MSGRAMASPVFVLLAFLLASGCSSIGTRGTEATPGTPAPVLQGKAIFEQKCDHCHFLLRATSRRETRETWTGIVARMQGKSPGLISDAEAAKIVDYLATERGKK